MIKTSCRLDNELFHRIEMIVTVCVSTNPLISSRWDVIALSASSIVSSSSLFSRRIKQICAQVSGSSNYDSTSRRLYSDDVLERGSQIQCKGESQHSHRFHIMDSTAGETIGGARWAGSEGCGGSNMNVYRIGHEYTRSRATETVAVGVQSA